MVIDQSSIDVSILKSSSRISALNIESVKSDHRGTFQCIAMNLAGRTEVSAELMVNGNWVVVFFYIFFFSVFPKNLQFYFFNPVSD